MPEIKSVSFRAQLKGQVSDFIEKLGMSCVETTQAVVELIVQLSHYEEEGTALYPKVLICDSLLKTLSFLRGAAPLELGRGAKAADTASQALKKGAPLAQQGWSIYIERNTDEFRYGVFREPAFPTAVDIGTTLAALPVEVRAMLACQMAERAVELVGTADRHLHIHLSAVREDEPPPSKSINALIRAAVQDAPESVRESLRSYLSSTIGRSLLHGHGALVAVVQKDSAIPPSLIEDGIVLNEPIDLARLVEEFLDGQTVEAMSALTAYGALLAGMLGSDGITVLRSDGAIIGYNFFVNRDENTSMPASQLIGGARRRAFATLASSVRAEEVLCAFIRSSNGSTDHKVGGQT